LKDSAILLLQCPVHKGLDAAIADFIYWHGGDILHFEQYQAGEERFFLARVEWDLTGFEFDLKDFPQQFASIAKEFSIQWRITTSNFRPRVVIFVSKYDHCLVDLLYRHRIGELACEIPLIRSLRPVAAHWLTSRHHSILWPACTTDTEMENDHAQRTKFLGLWSAPGHRMRTTTSGSQ
jgi:formyltetrahydrofolate deformylase